MNTGKYSNKYQVIPRVRINRLVVFGGLIVVALLAFEIFNYSTTEFALKDLLGGLRFIGIPWATILAIAFCGIDFAGLARMFTPEVGADEPREIWYLFGAWMLAAIMNAMLTWWGVSIAITHHDTLGNGIVSRHTLIQVVPVFVAIMVWLIRVLIIGTFSTTGDRLFGNQDKTRGYDETIQMPTWQLKNQSRAARSLGNHQVSFNRSASINRTESIARPAWSQRPVQSTLSSIYHPAPRTPQEKPPEPDTDTEYESNFMQADPVYVPIGMASRSQNGRN
jgi:hypothetical protein